MKGLTEFGSNYPTLKLELQALTDFLYVLLTPGRPIEDDGNRMVVGVCRILIAITLISDLDFRLGYGSARKEREKRAAYYDQIIYGSTKVLKRKHVP